MPKTSIIVIVTGEFSAAPLRAQESDIAKQAQNPIANLISVPIENDFNPQTGYHKEDSYVMQWKPVVPIQLSDSWILITRTTIPVIPFPNLAQGVPGASGLGDINTSPFLSPAQAGSVIWDAGPIVSFPTATYNLLSTKKVSAGPTAMFMRSFMNYILQDGWYLVSSPVVTANWEAISTQRWTVPLGGSVGKIVHLGKLPVNLYMQLFRNVDYPDGVRPSVCTIAGPVAISTTSRRWYECLGPRALGSGRSFRSRQVTGCIRFLRRDLVKEISQTCGWSAGVRPARDLE